MSVKCSLVTHGGSETSKHNWECFGFLYSKDRTSKLFEKNLDTIKYIKYFPNIPKIDRELVQAYLDILEDIGIQKVLEYPYHKLTADNYLEGVYADITTTSGQAFVGAFELIRNITNHPTFVELVVQLVNDGIDPEVALYIPRMFDTGITSPYADTTGRDYTKIKRGGETLFDMEKKRHKTYQPWTEIGDFSGVYRYYQGTKGDFSFSSYAIKRMRCNISYLRDCAAKEARLHSAVWERTVRLLSAVHPRRIATYEDVKMFCEIYQRTGDLKEAV